MGKYVQLKRLPSNLYADGSPVIIKAAALLKNTETDDVLAQLKIENLSHKKISAVRAQFNTYDAFDKSVGAISHQYLDLNLVPHGEYIDRKGVLLRDDIREITVTITEVVYEDGEMWKSGDEQYLPIQHQKKIENALSDDLVNQYSREIGKKALFEPIEDKGVWVCTCGGINKDTDEACHKCGLEKEKVFSSFDTDTLSENLAAYLLAEAERLEQERLEKERLAAEAAEEKRQKKLKTKKRLKKAAIITPIAAVIAVGLYFLTTLLIIPQVKYSSANKMVKNGEYGEAITAYQKLDGFRRSEEKTTEAKYLLADKLFNEEDYENAFGKFKALGDYEDSADRAQKSKLEWGKQLMNKHDYEKAYWKFKDLNNTKLMQKCVKEAKNYWYKSGEYYKLISFYTTNNIKRDQTYYNACYKHALNLIDTGEYQSAISYLIITKGHKDKAEQMIKYAKYHYVLDHKNNTDEMTYKYLKELKKENYKKSAQIYNNLYKWKVEIKANDKDYDYDSRYCFDESYLSKYDKWYFHIKVTGGTPDDTKGIKLKYSGTFPTGSVRSGKWNYAFDDGDDSWASFYYTNPGYNTTTGNFTFRVYDMSGNLLAKKTIEIY